MNAALIAAMNFLLNSKKSKQSNPISDEGKKKIDKINEMSFLEAVRYLKNK